MGPGLQRHRRAEPADAQGDPRGRRRRQGSRGHALRQAARRLLRHLHGRVEAGGRGPRAADRAEADRPDQRGEGHRQRGGPAAEGRGAARSSATTRSRTPRTPPRSSGASTRAGSACPIATTTSATIPSSERPARPTAPTWRRCSPWSGTARRWRARRPPRCSTSRPGWPRPAWTEVSRRDPNKVYHRTDRAGPEEDVARASTGTPTSPRSGTPGVQALDVSHLPFVAEISTMVKKVPASEWRSYLAVEGDRRARPRPAQALRRRDLRLREQVLSGAKADLPRWKKCVAATDTRTGRGAGGALHRPDLRAGGEAGHPGDGEGHRAGLRGQPGHPDLDGRRHQAAGAGEGAEGLQQDRLTPTSGRPTTAWSPTAARSSGTRPGPRPTRRRGI